MLAKRNSRNEVYAISKVSFSILAPISSILLSVNSFAEKDKRNDSTSVKHLTKVHVDPGLCLNSPSLP